MHESASRHQEHSAWPVPKDPAHGSHLARRRRGATLLIHKSISNPESENPRLASAEGQASTPSDYAFLVEARHLFDSDVYRCTMLLQACCSQCCLPLAWDLPRGAINLQTCCCCSVSESPPGAIWSLPASGAGVHREGGQDPVQAQCGRARPSSSGRNGWFPPLGLQCLLRSTLGLSAALQACGFEISDILARNAQCTSQLQADLEKKMK